MTNCCWMICFLVLSCFPRGYHASAGDSDPSYRACVEQCVKNGCVGERCFSQCKPSSDGSSLDGPLYTQEPLYLRWKQWDCQSDCHYHCMFDREKERAELGLEPLKYHGKWPFQRICGIQEPASVAFSALNLAMHFHGCLSFFTLLYYKLPLKPDKRPFYDYAGLWYIYGLLAVIAWFCSAVFHSRDVDLTEKLDYTFAVALLGYSLILAIIRSFSLRGGPARVMVAAPLIAFTITHIFFLNLYRMDYGIMTTSLSSIYYYYLVRLNDVYMRGISHLSFPLFLNHGFNLHSPVFLPSKKFNAGSIYCHHIQE